VQDDLADAFAERLAKTRGPGDPRPYLLAGLTLSTLHATFRMWFHSSEEEDISRTAEAVFAELGRLVCDVAQIDTMRPKKSAGAKGKEKRKGRWSPPNAGRPEASTSGLGSSGVAQVKPALPGGIKTEANRGTQENQERCEGWSSSLGLNFFFGRFAEELHSPKEIIERHGFIRPKWIFFYRRKWNDRMNTGSALTSSSGTYG
jgi:hypothetical protein